MRTHTGIAAILVVYLVLAVFYSVVTPVFEAPDELWHYMVIHDIADHRSLPIQKTPPESVLGRQEASQPPLYYLIGALFLQITGGDRREVQALGEVAELNPFGQPGDPQALENRNVVFHTPDERFPYSGVPREVHLLRLLSIAMGVATVLATYALALEIASGWQANPKAVALGAAVVSAGIPQFLFISGSVNNDNLITALGSLALVLAVRLYREGVQVGRCTSLGLLVGAAAVTKLSGLVLLPLVLAAIFFSSARVGAGRARVGPSGGLPLREGEGDIARPAMGFLAATGITAGWWYLRNVWLYGDPTGLSAMMAWVSPRTDPYSWSEVAGDIGRIWTSFWALFGWSNIAAEDYVYHLFSLLVALSALGWLMLMWRRQPVPAHARYGLSIILFYLGLLLTSLVRWHLLTPAPEGRLLFPGISGISTLVFLGIASLVPARFTRHLVVLVTALLLTVAATVPLRTIEPAYALPSAARVKWPPPVVREVHVKYRNFIELVAFGVDESHLQPGKTARFTFEWRRLAEVDGYYTFFAQVFDKTGQRVGGVDAPPGKGVYPVHLWPIGEPFYEVYEITIADGAASPGLAMIIAGVYDSNSGAPITAEDEKGNGLGKTPVVGRTKIAAPPGNETRPDGEYVKVDVALADSIVLSGYSLKGDAARPGAMVSGSVYWRALRPIPKDYVVFVQIVGPQGLVAQHDSQPDWGGYPTSLWDVGELVADAFTLSLKESVPEGEYTLIAGMYDPASGQRLKTDSGDYVELRSISVTRQR